MLQLAAYILATILYHFLNQVHTWFLKIDPVRIIGMCVRVCVRAQGY